MSVVVIPAYQPDNELIRLVKQLNDQNFSILVVNDGSEESYDAIFATVAETATVIQSPKNEGKGAALKRAFAARHELFPSAEHFITDDADGQHRVEDIIRVRDTLKSGKDFVLSVRKFQKNIPFRSKFGNDLSRIVYTIMNGHYFDDNQSGLRGFSVKHIDWLLKVKGVKYDYEMNMLCYADKQGIKITTLPIESVYIDGNKNSHFNPIADTVRIYKRLFTSVWPSCLGVAVWELLTTLATIIFGYEYSVISIPTAVMIGAFITFLTQRFFVFSKVPYKDGMRILCFSVIRATAYTIITEIILLFTTALPMFVSVNIAALLMLIVEYQIHKLMHKTIK